ncbi:unnamed protein product [Prorocentrum cordatum]|uniref:Uncharacterized protein n=1 Tax=Prorocentrum cordatum TaxID=2364126 RepID=A0ABN9R4S8_9DINO|nr:unnamed protein product [Polarella glacialis]
MTRPGLRVSLLGVPLARAQPQEAAPGGRRQAQRRQDRVGQRGTDGDGQAEQQRGGQREGARAGDGERRAALHLTCWSKTCVFWATRGTRWKQTEPKRLRRSSSSAFTIHKALPPPRLRCPMANWGSSDFGCHVRVIEETGAEESSCPVQSGRWAWPTEGGRETLGEGNWRLQVVRSKLWRRVGTSPHGRLR